MGVDFGPYLQRVLHDVKQNWYTLIPEAARAPLMKKGKVSIEFAILKDGKVAGLQLEGARATFPWIGLPGAESRLPIRFRHCRESSAGNIWPYVFTSTTTQTAPT